MASSSIPAFKAALLALLRARPNLANVQVTYGPPLPSPAREFIQVGDVDGQQGWSTVGGQTRQEDYTVKVTTSVTVEGVNFQTANERAFVLVAEIEAALRGDQTVSATVMSAQFGGVVSTTDLVHPDGNSSGVNVESGVKVINRI